jgi:hypothetical protein
MIYLKYLKSRKKPRKTFFIVKFPGGEEALIKCSSWAGLVPYTKYFNTEYEEKIALVAINWLEAIEFLLKGKIFNASR